MQRPSDMVRVDQDVRAYRREFAYNEMPQGSAAATRAAPIHLPGLRLSGSDMTLEDAVALASHSIGWGFRFAGPTERTHQIELPSREWTLKALLGELEYQTHHYVNAFPESRLIMVTRQRMYLAPPDALQDHVVPSSLDIKGDCRPCANEQGSRAAAGDDGRPGEGSSDRQSTAKAKDAPSGSADTDRAAPTPNEAPEAAGEQQRATDGDEQRGDDDERTAPTQPATDDERTATTQPPTDDEANPSSESPASHITEGPRHEKTLPAPAPSKPLPEVPK